MIQIQLTPLELEVLKQNVNREFEPMNATEDEAKAMNSVIAKAEKLMRKLDAYEELGNSLMEWFLKKYMEQDAK